MRTKQLIRQRLLQRRRTLLTRYRDELERAEEELAERETELVDRAADQWDARVLSQLGNTDLHEILAVIAALRRLDDGDYGVCTDCGGAIEEGRLDVRPEAATCIACATALERPLQARSA